MTNTKVNYWLIFLLFLFCLIPPVLFADEGDIVKAVDLCDDSTLITMKDAGMVVVLKDDVGENTYHQVTSIAIKLLESGEQTGYFDPGYPTKACGKENVMTITILEMEE